MGVTDGTEAALSLRSRWARRLSWLWFVTAAVWLGSDVLLLAGGGGVSWDVVAVPALVAIGAVCRRAGLEVDEDGFVVHEGLRSHRVLWAGVDRVEIDWSRRLDAPVRVHLTSDEEPLALQATWGLREAERAALLAALRPALAAHEIPVVVVDAPLPRGERRPRRRTSA